MLQEISGQITQMVIQDKVLKYEDTGGQYANIRFDLAADHSKKFDLTTNNIFTFKIYIPEWSNWFMMKFED